MHKHNIQRAMVENIKKTYPPGTRIELMREGLEYLCNDILIRLLMK